MGTVKIFSKSPTYKAGGRRDPELPNLGAYKQYSLNYIKQGSKAGTVHRP